MTPPHRIAAAVLIRDGRILLGHRHPDRDNYPNCWDLIGGHVEAGESVEDALRRECLEEIGVEIRALETLPLENSDPALDLHAFVVTDWSGEPTNQEPDEHDDLRWFRREELDALVLADPNYLRSLHALLDPNSPNDP
ncbi:NUDIX domain-containing protein [Demetria terragena]|uniref:NUDIX domain-containing protein n=1 Tax=Demetria terragena TaxID=63959 RepID=UPI00036B0E42|nr:NUDIX domain-containing protein [Demetria terragena]